MIYTNEFLSDAYGKHLAYRATSILFEYYRDTIMVNHQFRHKYNRQVIHDFIKQVG
jgi:hypothetical protein